MEELAKKTGCSKSYIWEIENNSKLKVSADIAYKIAQVLKLDIRRLLDDKISLTETESDLVCNLKFQIERIKCEKTLRLIQKYVDFLVEEQLLMGVMKERPILFSGPMVRAILGGTKTQTRRMVKPPKNWPQYSHCDPFAMPPSVWWWNGEHERVGVTTECPYGKPGESLWVREGHYFFKDERDPAIGYSPKDVIYQADADEIQYPWRSPIHMPRWASRITLEITGVRVERLQEISEEDASAEGCLYSEFSNSWEKINGPGSWNKNPFVWVIEFKRVV